LWLQDATFEKRLKVGIVKGTENPADVATKFLTAFEIDEVVNKFGVKMKIVEKRAKPDLKTEASRGVSKVSYTESPLVLGRNNLTSGLCSHHNYNDGLPSPRLAQENNRTIVLFVFAW
jgi:hypothetical protein